MKLEQKLKSFFKRIEEKLSVKSKIVIGLAVVLTAYQAGTSLYKKNDIAAGSVMITNPGGNRGGTGVIIESSDMESQVLTNSHVCRVVESGGLVTGRNGTFMVASYKHSQMHDLCMIKVLGNLGVKTKIAKRPPVSYYEKALISGHPALMPNVITQGHFSGRRMIEVMTGFRRCTEEDLKDPGSAFICLLTGGMPIVKRYDSVLVTATIMPGSSGSGVYNEDMELSGLAFAGSSGFGYAWTVPYEALREFVDVEQYQLRDVLPNNILQAGQNSEEHKSIDEFDMIKKIRTACKSPESDKAANFCDLINSDKIWIK